MSEGPVGSRSLIYETGTIMSRGTRSRITTGLSPAFPDSDHNYLFFYRTLDWKSTYNFVFHCYPPFVLYGKVNVPYLL